VGATSIDAPWQSLLDRVSFVAATRELEQTVPAGLPSAVAFRRSSVRLHSVDLLGSGPGRPRRLIDWHRDWKTAEPGCRAGRRLSRRA
jgi:hypothetical protein